MLVNSGNEINKYLLDTKIDVENITNFINLYKEDKLEVYYKSQDIPYEESAIIKSIVGKNFKKIVIDNYNKDVLVLFYTLPCDNC